MTQLVYINDVAEHINSLNCGINIDDIQLRILLYGDDIASIALDENSFQHMLDIVSESLGNFQLTAVRLKLFTSDLNPVANQTMCSGVQIV